MAEPHTAAVDGAPYRPPHQRHPGVFAALLLAAVGAVPVLTALLAAHLPPTGANSWPGAFAGTLVLMVLLPVLLLVGLPLAAWAGRRHRSWAVGAGLGALASVLACVASVALLPLWLTLPG